MKLNVIDLLPCHLHVVMHHRLVAMVVRACVHVCVCLRVQIDSVGAEHVFLGSRLGNSLLLGYNRKALSEGKVKGG